jgi:hypothetical protein
MRDLRKAVPETQPERSGMEQCRPFINAVGAPGARHHQDYEVR